MTSAGHEGLVIGWAAITKRIGVGDVKTAMAYAKVNVDPLPVRVWLDEVRASGRALDEWVRRRNGGAGLVVLSGEEVMAFFGWSSRTTLWKYANRPRDPLPLIPDFRRQQRRSPRAYEAAARDWSDRQDVSFAMVRRLEAA